jgi:ribosomal protein S18 acetylase RimI-like enzyme
MEGLVIRHATKADCDRIADIINDPPPRPSLSIAGDERRARAAGRLFVRQGLSVQLASTVVGELDGRVIAMMDAARGHTEVEPSPMQYVRLLVPVLRAVGPAALVRFIRSRPAWQRVSFKHEPDDYYISELNVTSAFRNRGIGAVLLRHAETEARRLGCPRMALSTGIENPAQRLYQRQGFRIIDTKRDADYERYGGGPGRVFMVKTLAT